MAGKKQKKKVRGFCTDCKGKLFSKDKKDVVWGKRKPHSTWGFNWGYDKFDFLIHYDDYGNVKKKYGWDIDHSKPVSEGGTDHINNLQPLQSWYNRYKKADRYPWTQVHHAIYFKGLPDNLK